MQHISTFISGKLYLAFIFGSIFGNLKVIAQAPAGYYDDLDGISEAELKLELHRIIRGHQVSTYAEVKDFIVATDADPENEGNIILFYTGRSQDPEAFGIGANDWNREHSWPKSHGFPNESDTAYTDLHHLRATDGSVNSNRSNKDFNNVEHIAANEEGEAPDTYTDEDFWEPRDEIKGDVARMMFYMDVRYESLALDLTLVDRISHSDDPDLGVLYTLIEWHELDPVDQYEIDRNNAVYAEQQNRNPFVDHPEWVGDIWGNTTDPLLLLNTESFNPDFGMVPLGEPATQVYSLNSYKLQSDVEVTVTSPFEVSLDGENWSSSAIINKISDMEQSNNIYLRFVPNTEGATYQTEIIHSTNNGREAVLSISGSEGEIELMTISEAREKSLGETVKVTGVVIDQQNNNADSRVIYDGTAGIVVRSFDSGNESAPLVYGDSVLVSGILGDYNNLLQISESPVTIDLLKQDAHLPEPQELLISEIGESGESELVVVKDVWFLEAGSTFAGGGSAGNFTISDGENEIILRIGSAEHPLVGTEVPSGIYDITGFVGQFADDYQLSPRSLDDLAFVREDTLSITSILEARNRGLGERIKITGVVIGGQNNSAANRVIYDGTAGIVVRSFDEGNESSILINGDSVLITGGLDDYNNLLQISESPISIEVLKQDALVPGPQELLISEIGESEESELVTINNVTFVESGSTFGGGGPAGNFTITDGEEELVFRIGSDDHPLVGTAVPSGTYNITGIIGQFQDEYQISPRDENDLTLVNEEVTAIAPEKNIDINVYPNPVSNKLYIKTASSKVYNIRVFNSLGKKLLSQENSPQALDVSTLKQGLYILIINSNNDSRSLQFIKE